MSMPRVHWDGLPVAVRKAVEERTGPVLRADTASAGVNSGIAATLHTAVRKVFVKGIPKDHPQLPTQQREAQINPHVLAVAPRMLWRIEVAGWNLLGFEHIAGRHADFAPGSSDLPKVADALRRLQQIRCPDLPLKTIECRWATFTDASTLALLRGDSLLHTDFAPHNVLITDTAYIIDWAWPTRGPAWVDSAILAIYLMDSGHSADQAEAWLRQFSSWRTAPREAVGALATANDRLWEQIARDDPQPWKKHMAEAAHGWAEHRHAYVRTPDRISL